MSDQMQTSWRVLPSPLGDLLLTATPQGLTGLFLYLGHSNVQVRPEWVSDPAAFTKVAGQLEEYFAGERREFDVPLDLHGTPFQLKVWGELCRISYGTTLSYGQLAQRIGQPTASRAVGLANGRNPVSIIVPCHRVIGANGTLTGYGGGLHNKQALLDLERRAGA